MVTQSLRNKAILYSFTFQIREWHKLSQICDYCFWGEKTIDSIYLIYVNIIIKSLDILICSDEAFQQLIMSWINFSKFLFYKMP